MPRTIVKTKYASEAELAWLREQVEVSKISQAGLADALGIDASAVSRIMTGGRRLKANEHKLATEYVKRQTVGTTPYLRRILSQRHMTGLAFSEATGIPTDRVIELIEGKGVDASDTERGIIESWSRSAPSPDTEFSGPARFEMLARSYSQLTGSQQRLDTALLEVLSPGSSEVGKIVIWAAPVAIGPGHFRKQHTVAERRARPPALADVESAFGMLIEGDHLAPRYCDGEVIFVHPNRSAPVGKWTMVIFDDDEFFIGRLLDRGENHVVLDVLGAGAPMRLQLRRGVRAALIIGGWAE